MEKSALHPTKLRLLGPPSLTVEGKPVHLERRKSLALLAYVALQPGSCERDALAALFWPESPQAAARTNLRSIVLDLARILGPGILLSDRERVGMAPGMLAVDTIEFLRLAKPCPRHDSQTACPSCSAALAGAAEAYRGAFMEGFSLADSAEFDDWQAEMDRQCSETARSVYRRLTAWHRERGEANPALDMAARWTRLDPYDEEARRALISLYGQTGRLGAAEEAYRSWSAFAAAELGVKPDAETDALVRGIFASRQSAAGLSMVGRREDELKIRTSLREHPGKLHTITGQGGIGKTLIAKSLAAHPEPEYTGASVFIDLSSLSESSLVLSEIAAGLGVSQAGTAAAGLQARIVSILRGRRSLVVLDNFEQLLPEGGRIGELAALCPNCGFLVTSRVALGIAGEIELALHPLESPPDPDACGTDSVDSYPALRLFLERARSARPGLIIGEEETHIAARICSLLGGLPLALELAASRLVVFSLRELEHKIGKTARILAQDTEALPERHRSIHAAIAWSYDLLNPPERLLLERLSVFAGGFDIEAAEAVCGPTQASRSRKPAQALGAFLDCLLRWRLIEREEKDGRSRFRIPEAIREFAGDRLASSGQSAGPKRAHASFYLDLASDLDEELRGENQLLALRRMKEDHANFMAAFGFFLGGRDNRRALALLDAMEWYWYRSGRYAEGCSAIDATLALAGTASAPPELVGSALRSRAWLALLHGDWTGAEQAYRRSSEILKETQDRAGLARSLSGLGLVERWLGKEAEGFSHCRQGLAEARSTSDPRQLALALIWLYANTGGRKVDEAHQAGLEEILVLARKANDPWCEAHAFQGLGDYLRENGDIGTSILCYEESLGRFEALGEELMKAWTLEGLGMAKIKAGESEAALARLRDSCSIFMRLGDRGDVGYLIGEIGLASIASGRTDLGLTLLGASFGILRGMTLESGPAPCASAQASLGAPVPSRLAAHFDEAKRRDPSLWTKGLYLSLDQAIDLALDRTNA